MATFTAIRNKKQSASVLHSVIEYVVLDTMPMES